VLDLIAIGDKHGAISRGRLARRYQLWDHRHIAGFRVTLAGLDQTHPTTCHNRQTGMPAIMRHINSSALSDLNAVQSLVVADFDFVSVYDYNSHCQFVVWLTQRRKNRIASSFSSRLYAFA
jgi:hypothetical protein